MESKTGNPDTGNLPLVSICCLTYNHSSYIRDAIEGFLMQLTDFPFEIIIHDDASTDGTAEIIKEYAEMHSDLIFPILQSENQYSKKLGRISARFVWPRIRGQYIAICEGDDYWTDPLKLQKQIDGLRMHPACDICFHSAVRYDALEPDKNEIKADYGVSQKIFTTREVIVGEGGFMPTTSIILRKRVIENLPEWYHKAPVGDYYLQILGSLNGGALYLGDNMAVYRANNKGSWTERAKSADFRLNFYLKQMEALDQADSYLKNFSTEFNTVKRILLKRILKDKLIGLKERNKIYYNHIGNLKFIDRFLWKTVYRNRSVVNSASVVKKLLKSSV